MGYLAQALTALQLASCDQRGLAELETMGPAQREKLRASCLLWAERAAQPRMPRSGVLLELVRDGRGRQ